MTRILLCQKQYDCIYQEADGTITHQTSKYLDYRFDKLKELCLAWGYKRFPENSAYSIIEPHVGKNISASVFSPFSIT